MLAQQHQELLEKIWAVANKLRGPYRPPQYRRVMLPVTATTAATTAVVASSRNCALQVSNGIIVLFA